MTVPDETRLYQIIEATWPPAATAMAGPWTIRDGGGGQGRPSSRVTAATDDGGARETDIDLAEAKCRALNQPPLFMIRAGEDALDGWLATRGYLIKDPVNLYAAPVEALLGDVPPVTSFEVWPPLAASRQVWAEGGIGSGRVAIMERATCRKVTLLGRTNDAPAGAAYIGIDGDAAMIHCVEIAPAHRRKGLERHLMRAAARWAQANGAAWFTLGTTRENDGANALYASLGMQVVGHYHYRFHPEG
jgi:N-acetylglutamate synthase